MNRAILGAGLLAAAVFLAAGEAPPADPSGPDVAPGEKAPGEAAPDEMPSGETPPKDETTPPEDPSGVKTPPPEEKPPADKPPAKKPPAEKPPASKDPAAKPPAETKPPPADTGKRRAAHAAQFQNVGAKKAKVAGKTPAHAGDLRALGGAHVEFVVEKGPPAKTVLYITDPKGLPWPVSDVKGDFFIMFSDGTKKTVNLEPVAGNEEGRWDATFEPKGTWPPFCLLHVSIGDMRYDTGYGVKPGGKKK